MLSKIFSTIKITIVLLGAIIIPLAIIYHMIGSGIGSNVDGWVDTYISSESVNLSKTIEVQLDKTYCKLNILNEKIIDQFTSDSSFEHLDTSKALHSIASNNDLKYIHIYSKTGTRLASSDTSIKSVMIKAEGIGNIQQKYKYYLDQMDDKSIVLKCICVRNIKLHGATNAQDCYIEYIIDWKQFDSYLDKMSEGSFPRSIYIMSPDFVTQISANALPKNDISKRSIIALGLHVSKSLDTIASNVSTLNIDQFKFKIIKREIQVPTNLIGCKLFIIEGVDCAVLDNITSSVMDGMFNLFLMVFYFWIGFCIIGSRFYNKTKEQLDAANAVSDSTPMAVIIFNVETGKVAKINPAGLMMLRIDGDVKILDMWNIFSSEQDMQYIKNAINADMPIVNYEILIQNFAGTTFWSISSVSPLEIEEKAHVVVTILDIHSRKEMEKKLANNAEYLEMQVKERTAALEEKTNELLKFNDKLEKAKIEADNANSSKTKFLTCVSNEFKTPLHAIVGYCEILQEEAVDRKDEVTAEDLKKIMGSSRHLLSLINEMLDISNIESGKVQLHLQESEIIDIIRDVEGVTMPLITENDNTLFIECEGNIGKIYTDTTKVRQCLFNIIGNAAKFSEYCKVTLKVFAVIIDEKEYIQFDVIDNGVGISPERLPDIFDSTKNRLEGQKGKGMGLGLSITQGFAQHLGGSVKAESELNSGSKFSLILPRESKLESDETVIVVTSSKDESIDRNLADESKKEILSTRKVVEKIVKKPLTPEDIQKIEEAEEIEIAELEKEYGIEKAAEEVAEIEEAIEEEKIVEEVAEIEEAIEEEKIVEEVAEIEEAIEEENVTSKKKLKIEKSMDDEVEV